jgi:hypothetical protein
MNFLKLIKEKMMELEPIMKEKRAEQFDSMVNGVVTETDVERRRGDALVENNETKIAFGHLPKWPVAVGNGCISI